MTDERITVYGPKASVEMSLRVDTGARNTIIPESVATRLGLEGPYVQVSTYGRTVTWQVADGYVASHGVTPVRAPIWIAPDGETPALGETAMAALGYKIVRPAPSPNFELHLKSPAAGAAQLQTPSGFAPLPFDAAELTYSDRLAVCRSCPNLRPGLIDTCGACGCPVRTRALSSCPQGRF